MEPCENNQLPDERMNEKYNLNIVCNNGTSALTATSIWGILRGLETFSQLLYPTENAELQIHCTSINDFPRYRHRGLLVDTARHFIPVPLLLKTIDALAYNKLNVFHWHVVDDQSFPYQSRAFPQLSEKGAYLPSQTYSPNDVSKIVQYAGSRGIRVIAEFDTPGHTQSWGLGVPQLLTPCFENTIPNGKYGPIDPTTNFTYTFMKTLLTEAVGRFADKFLHLGGDEVAYDCWRSNPRINKFMQLNNILTYAGLEGYYIRKLIDISAKLGRTPVVWEEIFANAKDLPKSTVIHVWRFFWEETMSMATQSGFKVILSSCWYLDRFSFMGGDWTKYYNCEPSDFPGNAEQKKRVLGGEACMWGEVVNEYNLEARVWPRASAAAEKLWSANGADTVLMARHRLEEHACRMNKRGIHAQPPNGPGFCEI